MLDLWLNILRAKNFRKEFRKERMMVNSLLGL